MSTSKDVENTNIGVEPSVYVTMVIRGFMAVALDHCSQLPRALHIQYSTQWLTGVFATQDTTQ